MAAGQTGEAPAATTDSQRLDHTKVSGMQPVLSVDIGATKVRAALVDADGRVQAKRTIPTNAGTGPTAILPRIAELVRQVMGDAPRGRVAGIGVGAPGPLDPWNGIVYDPPNLPGWHALPLRDHLSKEFGLPVYLGNDANLAALGEARFGAGAGVADLIYVTVSTGVGGGIISRGRLFLGAKGLAGELGHTVVEARGPKCNCGNVGCLEMLASGPAIARRGAAAARRGASARLAEMAAAATRPVSAEMVVQAARDGDTVARGIVERAGFYIGVGVVSATHLLNPSLVVIGGGVAIGAGDMLLDAVRDTIQRRAMPAFLPLPVVPAALGDDAGLLGAAALVRGESADGGKPAVEMAGTGST